MGWFFFLFFVFFFQNTFLRIWDALNLTVVFWTLLTNKECFVTGSSTVYEAVSSHPLQNAAIYCTVAHLYYSSLGYVDIALAFRSCRPERRGMRQHWEREDNSISSKRSSFPSRSRPHRKQTQNEHICEVFWVGTATSPWVHTSKVCTASPSTQVRPQPKACTWCLWNQPKERPKWRSLQN